MKKTNFIKDIKDVSSKDWGLVGRKAAMLGEMKHKGFLVPSGFCITTRSLKMYLKKEGFYKKIQKIFRKSNFDKNKIKKEIIALQNLIIKTPFCNELENEILFNFRKNNFQEVIVRSSTTVEDGADSSWAGIFASFLDVPEKEVITKIKKCWASLINYQAVFYYYLINNSNQKTTPSLAVIIQKMIKADLIGIASTINPVVYDKNKIIIEVIPKSRNQDKFLLERYIINKKKFKIEEAPIPRNIQISSKQIVELSELCIKAEKYLKIPLNIEWAYQNRKLYLLQARPITIKMIKY